MLGRFASRFGRLIWSQSRDIHVDNYEKHIVYGIYENGKYRYFAVNKSTDTVEWIQHIPHSPKPCISSDKWNKITQLKDL
jgi:hypothetical protein